ncbi:MAG TPA: hypothetical protein VJT83_05545 [Chitinophagaceae bacterium]|nr:hypothetical protein [Chitinophagaceae bacterium]
MRTAILVLVALFALSCTNAKPTVYVGCTPEHQDVRSFLGIPLKDSVDFIRWNFIINGDQYELDATYGVGKPGTPGFYKDHKAVFSGKIEKQGHYYLLHKENRTFWLQEINPNILYLLGKNKDLLIGNGGFSYTLQIAGASKTSDFFGVSEKPTNKSVLYYEGRTPCTAMDSMQGLQKGPSCNKLKWYLAFYRDPVTGKPSHYLQNGGGYDWHIMYRGKWEIIEEKNNRINIKLTPDDSHPPLYLVRLNDDLLYFTDAKGNLLVGDTDFSYVMNRREKELVR